MRHEVQSRRAVVIDRIDVEPEIEKVLEQVTKLVRPPR
jgi:hypothetical protein